MRRVKAKKAPQRTGSAFIPFCRERYAMVLVAGMPLYGNRSPLYADPPGTQTSEETTLNGGWAE